MTVRDGECPDLPGLRVADDSKLNASGSTVRAPTLPTGAGRNDFDMHVRIPTNPTGAPPIDLSHSRFT